MEICGTARPYRPRWAPPRGTKEWAASRDAHRWSNRVFPAYPAPSSEKRFRSGTAHPAAPEAHATGAVVQGLGVGTLSLAPSTAAQRDRALPQLGQVSAADPRQPVDPGVPQARDHIG